MLPEILSNTLSVRVQLWNYVAFTAERFAKATSIISGSGLTTPSF